MSQIVIVSLDTTFIETLQKAFLHKKIAAQKIEKKHFAIFENYEQVISFLKKSLNLKKF